MTPYSTLGHQVMMTDLFGPTASTMHLDIESVKFTTLTEPSFQADVRDLPLPDGSITTHTTNNLFAYLGNEKDIILACREIHRTLKRGGAYIGVESEWNIDLISWILEKFGCEITVEEATCFTGQREEMEYFSKGLPNNRRFAIEPGMYSIMAIKP